MVGNACQENDCGCFLCHLACPTPSQYIGRCMQLSKLNKLLQVVYIAIGFQNVAQQINWEIRKLGQTTFYFLRLTRFKFSPSYRTSFCDTPNPAGFVEKLDIFAGERHILEGTIRIPGWVVM